MDTRQVSDLKTGERPKVKRFETRPPFECIALLLQGGGALGAYQAGVYEALEEANLHPDHVCGISIGAINAALIAGNPVEKRVERLRQFWDEITGNPTLAFDGQLAETVARGDGGRANLNRLAAFAALTQGAPGFFTPRFPPPWFSPSGTMEATSFYDTAPLRETLERLIDFDRINSCETRFNVSAVNVRTGNFVYFDNRDRAISVEHVIASGALPPGFPAVEIDGEYYWDGGLVSNTPLQWLFDREPRLDSLAFQVDLWSARGDFPRTMAEVQTRLKEIQYSSRTRASTEHVSHSQRARNMVSHLLNELPPQLRDTDEVRALRVEAEPKVFSIVHLIYRAQNYEGQSKDYEFSRLAMNEHWRAGYNDTVRTLRHPEALRRPKNSEGVAVFDIADG
ncbi:MAG TPA: patatin-like phospholipase family protein [Stellaceae bacterium]|nr:patatin-like phospholipase family protein [Stellaceae bacterium]